MSGDLPGAVLFACNLNRVRSPMAEQLARSMLPPATFVASAGVHRGERHPFVDAVLAAGRLAAAFDRTDPVSQPAAAIA